MSSADNRDDKNLAHFKARASGVRSYAPNQSRTSCPYKNNWQATFDTNLGTDVETRPTRTVVYFASPCELAERKRRAFMLAQSFA